MAAARKGWGDCDHGQQENDLRLVIESLQALGGDLRLARLVLCDPSR